MPMQSLLLVLVLVLMLVLVLGLDLDLNFFGVLELLIFYKLLTPKQPRFLD